MSNYPEGVTGLEYEIAGPQLERDGVHEVYCSNDDCSMFESYIEESGTERWYDGQGTFTWSCDVCLTEYTTELPEWEEYDY